MDFLLFGMLVAVLVAGAFWVSRLQSSMSQNRGGTHGGGREGISDGVDAVD